MGLINIYAANFKENASGSIREDGGEIVNQSEVKVVQNGTKGIDYDKNKERKPPTDIRITKVEGPFDEKDKLVDKIVVGTSYTYKATPSRKPKKEEIALLKWSVKFDDGERTIINGVAPYNSLVDNKIIIPLKIKQEFKKGKIYAFYQKADENVSIEIKNKYIFEPYIIAKSRHRKGMNEDGSAKHHDMMSGDMTDQQIIDLNPDTKKWIDIVNKEGIKGIQKLSDEMADLLTDFSRGDLEEVNLKLHKKFVKNQTGDFSDEVLTKAAKEHEHTKIFFDRINKNIKLHLSENKDFVYDRKMMNAGLLKIKSVGRLEKEEVNLILKKIKEKIALESDKLKLRKHYGVPEFRSDIPSPSYPDKYGGLGIAINDTWGFDIKITKFQQDSENKKFSAEFEIEIFDHYGLNSEDIDPKVKGGLMGPANIEGFLCWFVLQHKCGYKPFLTIMKMKYKISNGAY
jgi:hypothetical protein